MQKSFKARKASIFLMIFAQLALAERAFSTIAVMAPEPYPQYELGAQNSFNIYYAGSTDGQVASGGGFNTVRGYRLINMSSPSTAIIYLDVLTNTTTQAGTVVTLSTNTSPGTEIRLTGAGVVSGNTAPPLCTTFPSGCTGAGFESASYSSGTRLRLAFSLADLCSAGNNGTLCSGGVTQTLSSAAPATLSQTIYVTFGVPSDPINPGVGPVSGGEQATINFYMTNVPPLMNCPGTEAEFYFPGDGQIYLKSQNFQTTATSGAPLQTLLLLAKSGGVLPDALPGGLSSSSIVNYPNYQSQTTVKGFNNDDSYGLAVYAQNEAGILTSNNCNIAPIRSRAIRGVLTESKCFIATAAFQDGRAAPVMLLRKFRDQVLSQFDWGQNFISKYYEISPPLAEWAWDKPFIRSVALRVLAPLEFIAWAWLKVAEAQETTSTQPYIDRLKKEAAASNPQNTETEESYTERQKKILGASPTPVPEAYIHRVKRELPAKDSSGGYSEQQKQLLPAEKLRESPIQVVKEGRDRKPRPEITEPIEYAASFKLGISPGTEVFANNGVRSFSDVYEEGWKPDFWIHVERQFIHSENFGSLAAGVDFGVNYASGYGLFDNQFLGSFRSITKFDFFQLPLLLNAYYRFNLARLIRPYAGIGVGSMFYMETRDDDVGSKRGYSFIYNFSIGASLLLDFFDRATARESYLSMGIQHTYLFVEYLYLDTISGNVNFQRSGIYSGFLFEF